MKETEDAATNILGDCAWIGDHRKEQQLGLVRGDHGDDEPVTGSGARMSARRRPGLHKSLRMIQRLPNSLPGTVAGRVRHSGKYFANDGLISAVVQLEVSARYFDRGDGPAITKAHQRRSRQTRIGRIECKAVCYRNQLFAHQILRQRAEIGIARDRNGVNKVQFSVRVYLPATAGLAPANMTWKLILMRFPVGERGEGF